MTPMDSPYHVMEFSAAFVAKTKPEPLYNIHAKAKTQNLVIQPKENKKQNHFIFQGKEPKLLPSFSSFLNTLNEKKDEEEKKQTEKMSFKKLLNQEINIS